MDDCGWGDLNELIQVWEVMLAGEYSVHGSPRQNLAMEELLTLLRLRP